MATYEQRGSGPNVPEVSRLDDHWPDQIGLLREELALLRLDIERMRGWRGPRRRPALRLIQGGRR